MHKKQKLRAQHPHEAQKAHRWFHLENGSLSGQFRVTFAQWAQTLWGRASLGWEALLAPPCSEVSLHTCTVPIPSDMPVCASCQNPSYSEPVGGDSEEPHYNGDPCLHMVSQMQSASLRASGADLILHLPVTFTPFPLFFQPGFSYVSSLLPHYLYLPFGHDLAKSPAPSCPFCFRDMWFAGFIGSKLSLPTAKRSQRAGS